MTSLVRNPVSLRFGTLARKPAVSLELPERALATHMAIFGGTGRGKSKFLEWLLRQLILQGRGFCLIDPHGDLCEEILAFIADDSDSISPFTRYNLHYLEPNYRTIFSFDPFHYVPEPGIPPGYEEAAYISWLTARVDRVAKIIIRKQGEADFQGRPRLERWLKNALYAAGVAIDAKGTHFGISDILILLDTTHPAHDRLYGLIGPHLPPEVLTDFYKLRQTRKPSDQEDWTESTLGRLRVILSSPIVQEIFAQKAPSIDFRRIIQNNGILLVNLKETNTFSTDQGDAIGGLIISEIITAARTEQKESRNQFYLFIDEAERFVGDDLKRGFGELRKMKLSLGLAVQDLSCLQNKTTDLLPKVLSLCGVKLTFQQTHIPDARALAETLSYPNIAFDPLIQEVERHGGYEWWETTSRGYGTKSEESEQHGTSAGTSHSATRGESTATNTQRSQSQAFSHEESTGRSVAASRGAAHALSAGESSEVSEGTSDGLSLSRSSGTTRGTSREKSTSHSTGVAVGESITDTEGRSRGLTRGSSHTDGTSTSVAESKGTSYTKTKGHTKGTSETQTDGTTQTSGESDTTSHGSNRSEQHTDSEGSSSTDSNSSSRGSNLGTTTAVSPHWAQDVNRGTNRNDTEARSATDSNSHSSSLGISTNESTSHATSSSEASSHSVAKGVNESDSESASWGKNQSTTHTDGRSVSDTTNESVTDTVNSSRSRATSQTKTETLGSAHSQGSSVARSDIDGITVNQGASRSVGRGKNLSHSETANASLSSTLNESRSRGQSVTDAVAEGQTIGTSSAQMTGQSETRSQGKSRSMGKSESVTHQPIPLAKVIREEQETGQLREGVEDQLARFTQDVRTLGVAQALTSIPDYPSFVLNIPHVVSPFATRSEQWKIACVEALKREIFAKHPYYFRPDIRKGEKAQVDRLRSMLSPANRQIEHAGEANGPAELESGDDDSPFGI